MMIATKAAGLSLGPTLFMFASRKWVVKHALPIPAFVRIPAEQPAEQETKKRDFTA
jgi:hypothetical protein